MPIGYLVNLGSDGSATAGDQIASVATSFTGAVRPGAPTSVIGAATWNVTGQMGDGTSVTNLAMSGTIQTDASGSLYFVPEEPMLTVTSATLKFSPAYNSATAINGSTSTWFGDNYSGTSAPNTYLGHGGDDTISGGSGGGFNDHDVLVGGAGNDSIYGHYGHDRLHGGAGNDRMEGGAGVDIVDYSDATSGINITLAVNQDIVVSNTNSGGSGQDTLRSVDGFIGSAYADTLIGYDIDNFVGEDVFFNYLDGAGGNDYIDGRRGTDYI